MSLPPHSIGAVSVQQSPSSKVPNECRAIRSEIAPLVRLNREFQGLTQHQLATRMGSTQSVIARWESGEHDITMANLSKLAEALGVEFIIRFGPRSDDR